MYIESYIIFFNYQCTNPLHGEPLVVTQNLIAIGKSPEGLSRDGKIAVASSVTVFTMASILFFTVGFLCGNIFQKKRKITPDQAISSLYDTVQPKLCERDLELKANVAYGPIHVTK